MMITSGDSSAASSNAGSLELNVTTKGNLELRARLLEHLLALSFHGFEQIIHRLLNEMGYADVEILSRKSKKGRTRHGGRDIDAYADVGLTRARVIVQAKQYRRPVQRRFVDELRGVMLRTEASQAVLVATSDFPDIARTTALAEVHAPVRLIDGSQLIDLLIKHRVGVRERNGDKQEVLDDDLFDYLQSQFPPSRPADTPASEASKGKSDNDKIPTVYQGGEMTWRTHTLAGISSLWLLAPLPHGLDGSNIGFLATVAAFGALLPDLDAAESKLKSLGIGGVRPFVPLSIAVNRAWGHRGLLHSPIGLMTFAVICTLLTRWWGWNASAALLSGYASHLLADASTKSGIPRTPLTGRFHLLPPGLRFVTGSMAEEALFPLLAAAALWLILVHMPIWFLLGGQS
jgi:membrane-bound metal-dependent hydrolase YbcI (DUF457 family)